MTDTHALPLYVQISEMLIRDIHAGRLTDGARLPPEREMAAELGISVGTLRKSLADLAEKGLLDRRQGSGNYVRQGPGTGAVYSFFRLELLQGGGLPTARVLSVDLRSKPLDLPAFGAGGMAHRIRRQRSLGGALVAAEEIWLCASRAPNLAARDLLESLYLFYRQRLGLWIARVEDRVGVGTAPDWGGLTAGPAGLIERVSWDGSGQSVEASRTWFDPARARYVARLS